MNGNPAYVKGHLISPKNPVQGILSQFVNKNMQFFTSEKHTDLIVFFFSFLYKYQFMDMYKTAS